MPGRKGVVFDSSHVRGVRIMKPVNVGHTRTMRDMAELGRPAHFSSGKIRFEHGGVSKTKRAFFKPVFGLGLKDQRMSAERSLRIMDALRRRGLPVPKAGLVEHQGQIFIAVEPFLRRAGERSVLVPINPREGSHTPWFLRRLGAEKDSDVIRAMARDTASIVNMGLRSGYFDFFGFYRKKDGSWKRAIMDVDFIREGASADQSREMLGMVVKEIDKVWNERKFAASRDMFIRELGNGLESAELKEFLEKKSGEVPFFSRLMFFRVRPPRKQR